MVKIMKICSIISLTAMVALALAYGYTTWGLFLTLAITFGTIAYHLIMRLFVSLVFNSLMHNKANCKRRWYRVGDWEMTVYKKLNVHKWKRKMPTYDSALYDPRMHSWSEIAQVTCQAELVHETIVVLSFLPIIAGVWFGAYPVFITTSVLAAAFDAIFVVIQRYNRRRIMLLQEKSSKSAEAMK